MTKCINRILGSLLLVLVPLILVACGGGGGGGADVAKASQEVAGSPQLGLVFVQNGQQLSYTDQGGRKTVTLSNAPFQVLIPDQKFEKVYLRASTVSDWISIGGNVMGTDPRIEDISGWRLKSVEAADVSVNGFSYESTTAVGTKRSLNIAAIYQRFATQKLQPSTLYFDFYLAGNPGPSVARETIKVILN